MKSTKLSQGLLLTVAMLLCAGVVSAQSVQSVTIAWDAPTTRENGSPLAPSELSGYELFLNGVSILKPIATVTSAIYVVPRDKCVGPTDLITGIAIDTTGQKSAISLPGSPSEVTCGPKSRVSPPSNVRVSRTPT